ncbi:hypothetical protein [Mesorhizobium sp. 128a]
MPTNVHSFPEIDRLRAEMIALHERRQRIVAGILITSLLVAGFIGGLIVGVL